jgi:ferrous iron transport protein B
MLNASWFNQLQESQMTKLTIALAGNPNAGKSTIFNYFTGLRQHTGNWPGKTVAKRSGRKTYKGTELEFVDLPGSYSLAAFSPDEIVAREFLLSEHPDAIICVVDATNLERNLYLVVQLLELGTSVVVALNMVDQAEAMGIQINTHRLSELLGGIPVVPTTASRGIGIDRLLGVAIDYISSQGNSTEGECSCQCDKSNGFRVDYGQQIESAIMRISDNVETAPPALNGYCSRWLAIKLLENETDLVEKIKAMPEGSSVIGQAQSEIQQLETIYQDDVDIVTADLRYTTVSDINSDVTRQLHPGRRAISQKIDDILTHRLLGLPLFLLIMFLVFRLVIDVSAPFLDWVDSVISGPVTTGLTLLLTAFGAAEWLQSLIIDGIVAGVGGILTFIPGLIVLFFFLAILEDTGYMARAAFVMDRFMQYIGLHGKSVIPLMLGFGCAVPAVYATRTIANRRDRLLTALLIPFMSCSARLPVYVVFAMAFFGERASTVIWAMYVLGVIVAIGLGFLLSRTILKPDTHSAFVLELPPYRLPTFRSLSIHTWENTREFVQKAGTVILAISVILWFLLNLPWGVANQEDSYYGQLSTAVAPVLEPTGFGSYENSGALITGLIAKELVVSTLSQVYLGGEESNIDAPVELSQLGSEIKEAVIGIGQATVDAIKTLISIIPGINLMGGEAVVEDTALSRAIQNHFSPLAAVAFLIFVLLYVPCIATMGAIKQEFGGRWATSAAIYQTVIAWLAAVIIFQGGRLIGVG